jgi:prepilin peptidase CpaA
VSADTPGSLFEANIVISIDYLMTALQVALLAYVAIGDVATRLISNKICLMLAALGIISHLFEPLQLAESLGGAAILFLSLLLMHSRGWIGGGDVKLLVALAIGLPVIPLLTMTALAGAVLALMHLTLRRLPYPSLPPVGSSLVRRVYAVERWRNLRHAPLPYGVAIASAGICIVLSPGV